MTPRIVAILGAATLTFTLAACAPTPADPTAIAAWNAKWEPRFFTEDTASVGAVGAGTSPLSARDEEAAGIALETLPHVTLGGFEVACYGAGTMTFVWAATADGAVGDTLGQSAEESIACGTGKQLITLGTPLTEVTTVSMNGFSDGPAVPWMARALR